MGLSLSRLQAGLLVLLSFWFESAQFEWISTDIKDRRQFLGSCRFLFSPMTVRGQSSQAELGDVLSLVKMDTGAVGTSLKCRAIAEMLMERCILEEAEGSERILAGRP